MPEEKRIVVAAKEAVLALHLESELKNFGYHVSQVVFSGEAALEATQANRPHAVLIDAQLGGPIPGMEAADRIRTQFNIPILFLTPTSGNGFINRAKIKTPHEFIVKPFMAEELEAAVAQCNNGHADCCV